MAVTVNATVGTPTSNSYITVAEADTYFESRLNATVWTAASAGNKDIAVVMSTRTLDDWVDWQGNVADIKEQQSLRWPRYDAYYRDGEYVDSDIIPVFLKEITSEMAMYLLSNDVTAEPDTKGFKELTAGPLKLVVDADDRDSTTAIPDFIKAMIEPYGSIRNRTGSGVKDVHRS
jgi:hypothetical protein